MSIEKLNKVELSSNDLRVFAKANFGSLKNMASAMGISAPHLQAYLSGKREFGASFREKLNDIGFFDKKESNFIKQSLIIDKFDIEGALELTGLSIDRLALLIGISIDDLRLNKISSMDQYVKLFNQIVALGLSRLNMLNEFIISSQNKTIQKKKIG